MSRTLSLAVTLLVIVAGDLVAQSVTVPLSESSYAKTRDAMRVWRFCEEVDPTIFSGLAEVDTARVREVSAQLCGDAAVQRVRTFVGSLRAPPTRQELDIALQRIREGLVQQTSFRSSDPDGEPAATDFLSFPTAALAVTDFFMDRARAELVQSVFTDLARSLGSGDLRILLPSAARVVRGVETIGYRSLLPTFRAALQEDLRALPVNLMDSGLSFYQVCVSADSIYGKPDSECVSGDKEKVRIPDGLRLVGTVTRVLLSLEGGNDVLLALSEMVDSTAAWQDEEIGRAIRVTARMALEMRAYRAFSGTTAARDGLVAIIHDPREGAVFLTFLQDDLDLTEPESPGRTQLEELARALNNLMAATTTTAGFPGTQADPTVARANSATAVKAVVRTGLTVLVDQASSQAYRRELDAALSLWRAVEARDYPRVVVLVADRIALGMSEMGLEAERIPMRVLSFASALAASESNEDMQAALHNLADPVGSFRSRRLKGEWKVSLVSYVGASGGRETLDLPGGKGRYLGAFAPIGLELSWGTGWGWISSVGVYGSFADLGTLVSFRLNDDGDSGAEGEMGVNHAPDINLGHVFSPAVHLVLGISRSYPLSLGIGFQHAPELRSLEDGAGRVAADRLSIFLGLDLTLLRF